MLPPMIIFQRKTYPKIQFILVLLFMKKLNLTLLCSLFRNVSCFMLVCKNMFNTMDFIKKIMNKV